MSLRIDMRQYQIKINIHGLLWGGYTVGIFEFFSDFSIRQPSSIPY